MALTSWSSFHAGSRAYPNKRGVKGVRGNTILTGTTVRNGISGVLALAMLVSLMTVGQMSIGATSASAASCTVILKGDAEAWSEASEAEATGGEVGIDQAYGEWADCLNARTDATMTKNAKLKERMRKLFNDEANFVGATFGVSSQRAGGGTMFAHGEARSAADLAQHRARLVALLLVPAGGKTSASIKARFDKAVATVNTYVARIKKPTATDLEFTTKPDWDEQMGTAVKAWSLILPVAGTKKDAAGLEIVEFIAGYAVP